MTPLELAKKVAVSFGNAEVNVAKDFDVWQIREFSVALMQQASQFSSDAQVVKEKPMNHPDAWTPRQNLLLFAIDVAQQTGIGTAAGLRWNLCLAEYARRWFESENPVRLQLAGDRQALISEFANIGGEAFDMVSNPREYAGGKLALLLSPACALADSVRPLVAYEQTYWLGLDGKHAEAKEANLMHAAACEATDPLGAAVFQMQAAKNGLDGKLEGAGAFLLETYEAVLPVLQEHREHQLAQSWMKLGGTMEGHLRIAIGLDANIDQAELLKAKLALARDGKFEAPGMGGM